MAKASRQPGGQGVLFDRGYRGGREVFRVPARRDQEHQQLAKDKLERTGRSHTQAMRIRLALQMLGDLTQAEITTHTGIEINAASGRIAVTAQGAKP